MGMGFLRFADPLEVRLGAVNGNTSFHSTHRLSVSLNFVAQLLTLLGNNGLNIEINGGTFFINEEVVGISAATSQISGVIQCHFYQSLLSNSCDKSPFGSLPTASKKISEISTCELLMNRRQGSEPLSRTISELTEC